MYLALRFFLFVESKREDLMSDTRARKGIDFESLDFFAQFPVFARRSSGKETRSYRWVLSPQFRAVARKTVLTRHLSPLSFFTKSFPHFPVIFPPLSMHLVCLNRCCWVWVKFWNCAHIVMRYPIAYSTQCFPRGSRKIRKKDWGKGPKPPKGAKLKETSFHEMMDHPKNSLATRNFNERRIRHGMHGGEKKRLLLIRPRPVSFLSYHHRWWPMIFDLVLFPTRSSIQCFFLASWE